jgi:multiple antibiotic resistance protein
VLLYASEVDRGVDYAIVLAGMGANLLLTLIGFLMAGPLTKFMGATVAAMITRIFGIILAALAAQFIVNGVKGAFGL